MLEDLQIRHYSPTTIRLYLYAVRAFAKHFGKPPDQLGAEHIRRYQLFLTKEKKVSTSTYVMMICGLRFFYTHTLHRKVAIEHIPFPRRERKLPLILSRDEVQALLEAPSDLRDRAMLAILYGSGLRVSEVTRLKVADIDSARNVLWVRFGKGRKDRQALLPPKLRELLRCYWRTRQPTDWLFPGARPGQPISVKTILHGLPASCPLSRHRQVRSSALATACLRDALAGIRRQSLYHSDPARTCQPRNDGALSASRRRECARDHQSVGIAGITPSYSTEGMKPHRLELADVLRTHQHDFLARWNSVLSRQQRRALRDIRDCRTAVLGGHLYECDRCGHQRQGI